MTRPRVLLSRFPDTWSDPNSANDRNGTVPAWAQEVAGPPNGPGNRPTHRERAQTLFDHRRARRRWFGEHTKTFQEAAWDILLELFLCHEDGRDPSTTSVAYGAGVPITTALRSMKKLEAAGLIVSWPDEADTRVRRIRMTPDAIGSMRGYLDEV